MMPMLNGADLAEASTREPFAVNEFALMPKAEPESEPRESALSFVPPLMMLPA